MRSIGKLTRRFLGILALSTFLLLAVNFVFLLIIAGTTTPGMGPWTTAGETEAALEKRGDGYILSDEMARNLKSENAWAIYIDNDTMEVQWHTNDLRGSYHALRGLLPGAAAGSAVPPDCH